MAEFNYTEYLRNNPLLKKEGKKPLNESLANKIKDYYNNQDPSLSDEESVKKIIFSFFSEVADNLKPMGSEAEIASYLESLGNSVGKEGIDKYLEYEMDFYEEDFQNFIADKSLEENNSSTKMKVSELKAKIKEDIIQTLSEQDEDYEQASREIEYGISPESSDLESELMSDLDGEINEAKEDKEEEEDVDVEVEDDLEIESEEDEEIGAEPEDSGVSTEAGFSKEEKDIQDGLKQAYDQAVAVGDEKLADQIGNTITMFTRTHIVNR